MGTGNNIYGQLGLGYFSNNISTPTLVPGINNVTDFSLGYDNGFILLGIKYK